MTGYIKDPFIKSDPLPVDIVFHPSWWYKHAGITFDEDFFYNPLRRVKAEKKMEHELYERFGRFGLGADRKKDLPLIGAVHNASGYILSEMLGCKVIYQEDSAPQVIPLGQGQLKIHVEEAFKSPVFKRFLNLQEKLKAKYGYVTGDIGWGGDVKKLRKHWPNTFLNIRLDPVTINDYSDADLEKLLADSWKILKILG